MSLRLANSNLKRIELKDGDFLDVVQDISKRDFNNLVAAMPQEIDQDKGLTPIQGTVFQEALFSTFVRGWSLSEPCTVDTYLSLTQASAGEIDEALVEHFTTLTPDAPKEKGPSGSRKR